MDGKLLPLHSRAFDVLECAVAQRDGVLSRDEITALVWRGMAVGENNLTVQMSVLRRALAKYGGDDLIVTFAGRGYRFVGDVTNVAPPEAPTRPQAESSTLNDRAAAAASATSFPTLAASATSRLRSGIVIPAFAFGLALAIYAGFALHLRRTFDARRPSC